GTRSPGGPLLYWEHGLKNTASHDGDVACDDWRMAAVSISTSNHWSHGSALVAMGFENHPWAVGAVLKNLSRRAATFRCPLSLGCVPSPARSPRSHVRPSTFRPFTPSAHRYGPQRSSGALTRPLPGSGFRSDWPSIWSRISQRTENADS